MTLRSLLSRPSTAPAPAVGGLALFDRLDTWPRQGLVLLVCALILRGASFGDTNLHIDEAFYFLVGQEMHHGAVPYVDIWDRKPLGLFLIYWGIAGISTSVIAYQLVAAAFAAATGLVIARIARLWCGAQGALLAGIAYLALLHPLLGFGGQAPVFYNLPIAAAFLLVLQSREALAQGQIPRRVFAAMLLGGVALTIKQTCVFECALLGLLVLYQLHRGRAKWWQLLRTALAFAALGLAPMAAIGLWYWQAGYWAEFWMAMTTSSFARAPLVAAAFWNNIGLLLQLLHFPALLAIAGILHPSARKARLLAGTVLAWAVAAIFGILAIRYMMDHHALPLLLPIMIAAAPMFERRIVGPVLLALVIIQTFAIAHPFDRATHRQSSAEMERMAAFVKANRMGRGLFVFDGPPLLYPMTGTRPLSPLVFPTHFFLPSERNISQFDTETEILAIVAQRPGVVVVTDIQREAPPRALAALRDWTRIHCRTQMQAITIEPRDEPNRQILFGQCE